MKLLTILFTIYIATSFAQKDLSTTYPNSKVLWDDQYKIFWKLDNVNSKIELALQVKTTGWLAFGLAEPTSGSMPGADIIQGAVVNGVPEIHDRYAVAKKKPAEDDCQNWELISGEEQNGWTTLEVKRDYVTNDSQDRPIVTSGNFRIVFSWGLDDEFEYHESRRKASSVYWSEPTGTKDVLATIKADPTIEIYEFVVTDYAIPAKETEYTETPFKFPPTTNNEPVHIVAIEHVLCCDPASMATVHHFLLYGCLDENCTGTRELMWAWAPGVNAFVLPSEAGFRASSTNGYQAVYIQTHYNNPELKSNLVDNSGIRVYFTYNLRPNDAGVLQTGDAFVRQPEIISQGTGLQKWSYECPTSCSSTFPNDLNVFSSFLHMHEIGDQIFSELYRDGQKVMEMNRIDFWDFNFQQGTPVNFVIKPGDQLRQHCVFKQRSSKNTPFGLGSLDEMCLEYITYYPKIESAVCVYYTNDDYKLWDATLCIGYDAINVTNPSFDVPFSGPLFEKKFGTIDSNYQCPVIEESSADTSSEKDSSAMKMFLSTILLFTFSVIML